jgi:hypothetical protein
MNIVAIDFSINSPGICILKDGNPYFIAFLKPTTGTKAQQALQSQMTELGDVHLVFQEEPNIDRQEMSRVLRHRYIAEEICNLIEEHTDTSQPYRIFFEGASYGTSRFGTNSLLDLASASSILKSFMFDRFEIEQLDVIAPTSIKKFVGKGNMKKEGMWEHFLIDDSFQSSPFWKFCKTIESFEFKKLPKPVDDLVDAYYLLRLAQSM